MKPLALPKLILASQSPRRKQLLENLGLPFSVVLPSCEECHPDKSQVEKVTLENGLQKARSVLNHLQDPMAIVIGADTLVVLGNEVIGKPANRPAAMATLQKLSGQVHVVWTGLSLLSAHFGMRQIAVQSRVKFRPISDAEMNGYADTIEPYDKAGAYAVQGLGAMFIEKIEGSYTNVMGLPIEAFVGELSLLAGRPVFDFFLPQ